MMNSIPKGDITGIYDIVESCEKIKWEKNTNVEKQNLRIKIPAYQRGYSWDKKNFMNFIEMLDDLSSPGEVNLTFMGQMIFHIGDDNQLEVVDGQQRLTSFLILAKILCEYLDCDSKKNDYVLEKERLENYLYLDGQPRFAHQIYNKKIIDEYIYLLEPEKGAHEDIKNVYDLYINGSLTRDEYRKKLKKIYSNKKNTEIKEGHYKSIVLGYDKIKKYCEERLFGVDGDHVRRLTNFLRNLVYRDSCKVMVSFIVFDTFDTAYEAFMSINSKGKDLEMYDLIRSEFIGNIDHDIENEWNENIDIEEVSKSKAVEIFEIMLKTKYRNEYKEFKTSDNNGSKKTFLYDALSYFCKNGLIDIEDLYNDFKRHVSYYEKMINGKFSNVLGSNSFNKFDDTVNATLRMDYAPFRPLIFEIIQNKELRTDSHIQIVLNIARYIPFIHVTVCDNKPGVLTNAMEKYLNDDEFGLEKIIEHCLEGNVKEIFSSSFKGLAIKPERNIAKDILLLIENKNNANKYLNHVEHILPQKYKRVEWDNTLERKHKDYLGNQIIAPQELNIKMNNSSFKKKMECIKEVVEKNEKLLDGFKYLSELYKSFLADEDFEYTLENIEKREEEYKNVLLGKFESMGLFR